MQTDETNLKGIIIIKITEKMFAALKWSKRVVGMLTHYLEGSIGSNSWK